MEVQSLENETKNNVMEKFIKLFEKYPDKDWDWDAISEHDNLEIDFINKFPDKFLKWNGWGISHDTFKKDYKIELKKLQNFKMIEEELIQKSWHPQRFQE